MITNWTLSNFKAIRSKTSLDFSPLTIFAGVNSAGKSSIIQSILLISQTLSSKVGSRSVVLNGQLARLGQFDDLRSFGSDSNSIVIGWKCEPRGDVRDAEIAVDSALADIGYYAEYDDVPDTVSCEIEFDVDSSAPSRDLVQLQPRLRRCEITLDATASDGKANQFWLHAWRDADDTQPAVKLPENTSDALRASLKYSVAVDDVSKRAVNDVLQSGEPVGCLFHHFLPHRIVLRYNVADEAARSAVAVLTGDRLPFRRRRFIQSNQFVLPPRALDIVRSRIKQIDRPSAADAEERLAPLMQLPRVTLLDWADRVAKLPTSTQGSIRRALQNATEELRQAVIQSMPTGFSIVPTGIGYIAQASAYLDHFFSRAVRYLGPLRDEPKPLYPLAVTADPTDVGLRGEHTAAVMDLHKARRIHYIPTTCFGHSRAKPAISSTTVETAVHEWLQYLGVAQSVETHDKGKLGHELKVIVAKGGLPQDLTHVGVGVSQVLPILVMCLLADSDTTLIIEQPELHLHPKVQTLLADFFLSMAMLNKQCLIETHSEYLISRLRYRAAAATEGEVSSLIRLYFVEPSQATSTFRNVLVNKYGAVEDWPDGFFDQGQREAESILRAAMEKRRQERGR